MTTYSFIYMKPNNKDMLILHILGQVPPDGRSNAVSFNRNNPERVNLHLQQLLE